MVCTWIHTNRHTETKTHREIEDREIDGKRQIDTSTYIYIGTHTQRPIHQNSLTNINM